MKYKTLKTLGLFLGTILWSLIWTSGRNPIRIVHLGVDYNLTIKNVFEYFIQLAMEELEYIREKFNVKWKKYCDITNW